MGKFRHSHLSIIKRCLANVLGEGEGTGWLERRSPMVWTGLLEHAMELPHHAHQNSSTSQQGGEKRDEPRMLLANIEEGSDKGGRESRISQLPSRRLCSRMERGEKK